MGVFCNFTASPQARKSVPSTLLLSGNVSAVTGESGEAIAQWSEQHSAVPGEAPVPAAPHCYPLLLLSPCIKRWKKSMGSVHRSTGKVAGR